MTPSAILIPLGSATVGVITAASSGANGIDFAGLAALVTAISGLIATIGAIYLGSRKKSNDATEQALKLLLELQQKKMSDEDANE